VLVTRRLDPDPAPKHAEGFHGDWGRSTGAIFQVVQSLVRSRLARIHRINVCVLSDGIKTNMVTRVLIIGGYGNFGAYITKSLSAEADIQLVIGGRSADKAEEFCRNFADVSNPPEWCQMDYRNGLNTTLKDVYPDIVIHTSGPFQGQGYGVAEMCIDAGVHYIDLADAGDFVVGIHRLDQTARDKGVLVTSGASSVPCLTAAIIDEHLGDFGKLEEVEYGITTAQQTNRGLATTSAVLSYAGRPFSTLINGVKKTVFGWQDFHFRTLPGVSRRSFANCDIPDLELFPDRYPDLRSIRFYAGLEVPVIHFGLWLLTWLVRCRLISSLVLLASPLLKISRLFDGMGSDVSAFFMNLIGTSEAGTAKKISFNLIARSGDGPFIPCAPAIILAKKLARGACTKTGAFPCIGLIDQQSYLAELEGLDIEWEETITR
jgi:hypothetical protein